MSNEDTMKAGPAFPFDIKDQDGNQRWAQGMWLRDYFAAKAMQGLIPQFREMFMENTFEDWVGDAIPALAEEAYYMADAMLKAREQ